jgi:hypothetical protein
MLLVRHATDLAEAHRLVLLGTAEPDEAADVRRQVELALTTPDVPVRLLLEKLWVLALPCAGVITDAIRGARAQGRELVLVAPLPSVLRVLTLADPEVLDHIGPAGPADEAAVAGWDGVAP